MLFWGTLLCAHFVLLGLSSAIDIPPWASQDPEEWPKDYPGCGGEQQSPVSIIPFFAEVWNSKDQETKFHLEFQDYKSPGKITAFNNGYNLNFIYSYSSESDRPRISLTEYGETTVYYMKSIHIHWPSEHFFASYPGKKEDVEVHIRHVDKNNGTLMLSYLFSTEEKRCNGPLTSLSLEGAEARKVVTAGDSDTYEGSPEHLLPSDPTCGYFWYNGSITIPPCAENVKWLVLKEPLCTNTFAVEAFKKMKNVNGDTISSNDRPEQTLGERQVINMECNDDYDDEE